MDLVNSLFLVGLYSLCPQLLKGSHVLPGGLTEHQGSRMIKAAQKLTEEWVEVVWGCRQIDPRGIQLTVKMGVASRHTRDRLGFLDKGIAKDANPFGGLGIFDRVVDVGDDQPSLGAH